LTKILGKRSIKNNVKDQSRQILIDYINMLNVADATKTLKNMKNMV